jgi:hypothetical protein
MPHVNWIMVASAGLNVGAAVWAAIVSRDLWLAVLYTMWGAGNLIMAFKG